MVEEFAAAAEPAGGHRLFLYYAMQNAHAPLQAPCVPPTPSLRYPLTLLSWVSPHFRSEGA